MHEHVWYKCKPDCSGRMFCEGGLGMCIVCNGFEGSLLTHCPGYRLNNETLEACYRGNVKDLTAIRAYVAHGARIKNGTLIWPKSS